MVIFHSYVKLPEGTLWQSNMAMENPLWMQVLRGKSPTRMAHCPASHVWLPEGKQTFVSYMENHNSFWKESWMISFNIITWGSLTSKITSRPVPANFLKCPQQNHRNQKLTWQLPMALAICDHHHSRIINSQSSVINRHHHHHHHYVI